MPIRNDTAATDSISCGLTKETEHQEHYYLCQPCEAVHEFCDTFLVRQGRIAKQNARYVYGKIAVASKRRGCGIGEEDRAYYENRDHSRGLSAVFAAGAASELAVGSR